MASVVVEKVQFQSPQAKQEPFTVRVVVNNLETVGPSGTADDELGGIINENPAVCGGQLKNDGHLTDVWLMIEGEGETWEDRREVCAPIQQSTDVVEGNPSVEFQVELPVAGSYSLRAASKVKGEGHPRDETDPYRLEVKEDASSLPEGGDSGGGGGAPNNRDAGSGPLPWDEAGNWAKTAVALIGLIGVAWALSSVSSIAEVFA